MSRSFVGFEKQQLVRCRILAELFRRRLPGTGGWSHCGAQCGTEPTSLALLALYLYPSGSTATREELAPLLAFQQRTGLWPAVADRAADVSFWASALAVNTVVALGTTLEKVGTSLDALVHCRPRDRGRLRVVRLKFRLLDRQVRFDLREHGWPWVPDTLSWVLPSTVFLCALTLMPQLSHWLRSGSAIATTGRGLH
jgi:hypothetical protein